MHAHLENDDDIYQLIKVTEDCNKYTLLQLDQADPDFIKENQKKIKGLQDTRPYIVVTNDHGVRGIDMKNQSNKNFVAIAISANESSTII